MGFLRGFSRPMPNLAVNPAAQSGGPDTAIWPGKPLQEPIQANLNLAGFRVSISAGSSEHSAN
jgi:hypothetical protein